MITINQKQLGQKIFFRNEGLLKLSAIGTIQLADISIANFFTINTDKKIYYTKENFKLNYLDDGIYQLELLTPVKVRDFVQIEVPTNAFVFSNLYSFNAVITEL